MLSQILKVGLVILNENKANMKWYQTYQSALQVSSEFLSEWFASLDSYEPGHEKMCLMSYANNKGADQPAHPRSLISGLVVRCLDSIISLDSIAEISRL